MTVYIIAEITIHDREKYENDYQAHFQEIFEQYDGTLLSVDENPQVLAGEWTATRSVLMSFPSKAAAFAWMGSDAYQAIAKHRMEASTSSAIMTTGMEQSPPKETKRYGLIGKMIAVEGKREALMDILINNVSGMQGTPQMPGCLSYIVAKDMEDANALWVTEVWESQEAHQASLSLPSVQAAIAEGRPLIAGFGERFETTPIGGHGI